MSLLGRIREDQDKRLLDATTARLNADRAQASQATQLESIIRDTLEKFANSLEEELSTIDAGTFYRLGDIVLQVELHQKNSGGLPDPDKPTFAIMEYLVWVLAVDRRSGRIDRVRWERSSSLITTTCTRRSPPPRRISISTQTKS